MTLSVGPPRIDRRIARILAVARLEVLHLMHDLTTLWLIVLIPAIQMVLFGYAVNLDPKDIRVAIAGSRHGLIDQVRRTVLKTGYFVILADGLGPGGAERMVEQGKALIGIEVPSMDGSERGTPSDGPRVVVDGTDPAAVRPALAALETTYWQHLAELSAIGPVPSVDVEWLYNPESRTDWAIVPGLVGVVVMISMLMLGALTLVRERERGSWEALLATPVRAVDALVGKLSPYVIVGTVQAAIVICIARLLFHLPATGNLWALFVGVPLYASAHLILGFGLSALAESQMQAIQAAVFFYLPSMLLSGFMFPFQGMPTWARTIGETLPLTHFVRATRGVLLKGGGASLVAFEMLPVVLFTVIAAALALAAYRRRID